jgi:hypothetical protein
MSRPKKKGPGRAGPARLPSVGDNPTGRQSDCRLCLFGDLTLAPFAWPQRVASRSADPEVLEHEAAFACAQRAAAARADQLAFIPGDARLDAHEPVFGPARRACKRGVFGHGIARTTGARWFEVRSTSRSGIFGGAWSFRKTGMHPSGRRPRACFSGSCSRGKHSTGSRLGNHGLHSDTMPPPTRPPQSSTWSMAAISLRSWGVSSFGGS